MDTDYAATTLISCLKKAVSSFDNHALAFSGGIDSTLLLHLSGYRLKPYTIGVPGSRDFQNSEMVSSMLGFEVNRVEIGPSDVEEAVKFLLKADPAITAAEAGYESVLYLVLKYASESAVVTGQGSDELFYGYRKYLDGVESNTLDMEKLYNTTLPRERNISRSLGKELLTPFLEKCVTGLGSALVKADCISDGTNKIVVRRAAEISGLPAEIVDMPKKAAQYGSGIQKLLRNIDFGEL